MNGSDARAASFVVAAIALWIAGAVTASGSLQVMAGALLTLPAVAAVATRRRRRSLRLEMRRASSTTRAAPGEVVQVAVEIHNPSTRATPLLLVEDQLPASLGGPRRMVVDGVPAGARVRAGYRLTPTARGRFPLGPLRIEVPGPFGLSRIVRRFDARETLVVVPAVEDLTAADASAGATTGGTSLLRRVRRGADEFASMRAYQEGDDLRRIHWPSVARRGELMIRQDESSTRSRCVLFADTRSRAAGRTGERDFESLVSAVASVGAHFARAGFHLRAATTSLAPRVLDEHGLLDLLAGVESDGATLSTALGNLRSAAAADTVLVAVLAVPDATDLVALTRLGVQFGPRVAVLIDREGRSHPAPAADRANAAVRTLVRAGWEVVLLGRDQGLGDAWRARVRRGRFAAPA